ncbi:hypothetical protein CLM85_03400, partial [Streptomyces albidoflavus]
MTVSFKVRTAARWYRYALAEIGALDVAAEASAPHRHTVDNSGQTSPLLIHPVLRRAPRPPSRAPRRRPRRAGEAHPDRHRPHHQHPRPVR